MSIAPLQCHKAKNLVPEAGSQPTRTGEAVLELQVFPIVDLFCIYYMIEYHPLFFKNYPLCLGVKVILPIFLGLQLGEHDLALLLPRNMNFKSCRFITFE